MNNRRFRHWRPLLLGMGCLVLAHYAALLFRIQAGISPWFPPSGVAISLAIWFGPSAAIITGLVSTLIAPLWGNQGWMQWMGWIDAVEPLMAWWLYRQVWQRSPRLEQLRDVSAFILSGPVLACAGSALVGLLPLGMMGLMPWQKVLDSMPRWWLGNAIGTMSIAPLALLTLTPILQRWGWVEAAATVPSIPPPRPQNPTRLRAEILAILNVCVAIALLSVSHTSRTGFAFQQFAFLNFIPIFWAALRFGAIGGTSTASFCVLMALLSYVLKYPDAFSLQNFPADPSVLIVHKLSLFTQCVVGLLMGTAITQQTQTQVKLAISQVQLTEYVARAQLTEELAATNQTLSKINAELEQANREKDELLIREQTARSQAESANRIKDEFLAIVSHELRTPLNPILGWSKLLLRGKLNPTAAQKALETINRNVNLQLQLIEDLLDVSRILRGKLVLHQIELDLGLVVRSALETVRLSAEAKTLTLTFISPDSDKILVYGDPNRLQQVVVNLLTNAIKFTPAGGRVEVMLEHDEETHSAQIQVRDTGKGIHPDFLPHVFERFRQEDQGTTRNFGGLGLGLAIVRHLIEMHQGRVAVQSEGVNCGATFTVYLPTVPMSAELPLSAPPASPQSTHFLQGKRILVVEDDADTRELLRHVLEAEQATVQLAASAQEALSSLNHSEANLNSLPPDLILSDISMPEMDGYGLIRQIRAHTRTAQPQRIPAIALTANVREEDRLSALAAGFDAHIAKPIPPEQLLTEIEKLLVEEKQAAPETLGR